MAARVLSLPPRLAPVADEPEVLGILGLGAAVLTEQLVGERGERSRPLVEELVGRTVRWVATEPMPVDDGLLVVESVVRSLLDPPASAQRPPCPLRLVPPAP